MTGRRGVFCDGKVGMFAISMLTEPGGECSNSLTIVFHVTVTAFYTTLFLLLGFRADQQIDLMALKGLWYDGMS